MDSYVVYFAPLSFMVAAITAYRVRSSKSNLPPGPPGLPVLGNILDIASAEPWLTYRNLGEKYGDIVHVRILTQDVIILNSHEAVRDLLELRSQNYSSRPHMPVNNMMDVSWNTGFMPYDDERKAQRKMFQQALRSETIASYHPMMAAKTQQLLKNMRDSPTDFIKHFRTYSTAVAMAATFDYHLAPQADPVVAKLKEIDDVLNYFANPVRSAIIGAFPLLTYLHSWFPGATGQHSVRKAIEWWYSAPFNVKYVQDKMAEGPIAPSILGEALSRMDEKQRDMAHIVQRMRGVAATSLFAASETIDAALQVFVLAMVMYPDVQRRAQDEIRAVVGAERLPESSDRPNLPYIEAVWRETLRWHPALPFAVPRTTEKDDIYRGYKLPKGATILPNVWAIAHDETRYQDPSAFNPSRFFDEQGNLNNDTVQYVFGFGKRLCSGRLFGDSSVWLAIARLLSVFSFEAPLDDSGKPIKIVPKFVTGLTSRPEHIPVHITMRFGAQEFAGLSGVEE